MEKPARYLTTTLPYVNSDPHIGFACEVVTADALARLWRESYDVFFNTGTDEHGQKIAQKADEQGQDRQVYVDHFAGEFQKLGAALNLSYDKFIRTTDPAHKAAAQAIWQRCAERGDIYKKKYSGLYCVGCELFYKESELHEGNVCPIHQKPCQVVQEENYFFALSQYQQYLEEYLSREGVILPEWRRQEALDFVRKGLEDFSISREKSRLDWGIPVPGDEGQVMYVWFDALTNYISTLGWPSDTDGTFAKFWEGGEVVQLAGKDQVRFQSIMWQAMLRSAGVKATDRVVYHGFITSGGQKMSKSIGNVISPYDLVAKYGTDATRYLLLRHVHPFEDTDVTWERLDEWYTAHLVNGLGNLVSRVMKMMSSYQEQYAYLGEVVFTFEFPNVNNVLSKAEDYRMHIAEYNLSLALEEVWKFVGRGDETIAETEPFKLVKTNPERAIVIVVKLVQELYRIAILIAPFMPETSHKIIEAIKANQKPENLFSRLS